MKLQLTRWLVPPAITRAKLILSICILWLGILSVSAQSCCAGGGASCCASGSGGCSILPELDKHIIGLNYSYSLYNTSTYPGMNMNMSGMDMAMMGPGTPTKGTMNTIQLYGRFNLPKRFQVSVSVPVSFLREQSSVQTDRSAGLGDVSAMLFYSVFGPKTFANKKSKHQIRLGAGVKAPTGKFNMTNEGLFTTDLQLGTGGVDFLFNINYTYTYKRFGFMASANYKKDLDNKYHYQFGDIVGGGLNAFYALNLPKGFTVTPRVGSTYNHMFYNVYTGEQLLGTGGDVLRATAGCNIYYKHFILSTAVSPVLFSITNWSGEPVPVLSFETGFYYSF